MKFCSTLLLCCSLLLAKETTFNREVITPGEIFFDVDNSSRSYLLKPAVGFEILTRRSDEYGDFLLESYHG